MQAACHLSLTVLAERTRHISPSSCSSFKSYRKVEGTGLCFRKARAVAGCASYRACPRHHWGL